ncbi:permease [Clostridium formicaceticum]|uniref:Permease n=1 Tax=Clostridium formicaceticum TaxID=1497 RepID=A0AAC9RIB0_9CLOT|nr:permease [Clostridium formicaceticum]AOY75693.1 permease [Clostridium formicaceticum]ARE86012.1 putative permease [Clostridium formicaceticum]
MANLILYATAFGFLGVSYVKDRKKTKMALKKAWKAFENILPQFLGIIIVVGLLLSILNPEVIARILGGQSGWFGVVISSVVGAITLMPPFVAFPTAALLLENGAGLMQMAAFVSSLMMVGVVTAPIEMQYLGKKLTLWRNVLAFIFSFLVAYVMGRVV